MKLFLFIFLIATRLLNGFLILVLLSLASRSLPLKPYSLPSISVAAAVVICTTCVIEWKLTSPLKREARYLTRKINRGLIVSLLLTLVVIAAGK